MPVYFYFSRNPAEPERSKVTAALASIARQLASLPPGRRLLSRVLALHENKALLGASRRGALTLKESQNLILELVDSYAMTTIILDALDECEPASREDASLLPPCMTTYHKSSCPSYTISRSRNDVSNKC